MTADLERHDPDLGARIVTTEISLALKNQDVSLTIEEWSAVGRQLGGVTKSWLWWLGDWFALGVKTYGSTYTEAMAITGLAYQTLADCAYVASRVASSSRNENLSFAHHRAVAPFNPQLQKKWLDRAAAGGWSVLRLRQAIANVEGITEHAIARLSWDTLPDDRRVALEPVVEQLLEWAADALTFEEVKLAVSEAATRAARRLEEAA